MASEYNELKIINDEQPKNAFGQIDVKNNAYVAEVKSVGEVSEKVIEESGSLHTAGLSKSKSELSKSIGTAVSRVTVTASAATVVAAVIVVAAAVGTGVSAPLTAVSGAGVDFYDGADVRIEFILTDEDGELDGLYAWIEDGGEEIACTISSIDGVYFAETTLVGQTGGELYFVVYGETGGGWSGELYREILTLPQAPEAAVEYTAAYTAESGELVITYTIDESWLSEYTVKLTDGSGSEIDYTPDYAANTVTATISDASAELYFVVTAQARNGWYGEIYRDGVTIPADEQGGETENPEEDPEPTTPDDPEPTAPDIELEFTTTYNANNGELVITYTLDNSQLSGYTVKLTDGSGNEISSTVAENTITATVTDASNALYIVVSGTTTDGWTGEIGSYAVTISTAPDIGLEFTTTYNANNGELVITYSLDNSQLSGYTVKLTDGSGGEVTCAVDYAAKTITATIAELAEAYNLVIEAVSADGWTGELHGAVDLSALPPTVEVTGAAVTLYNTVTDYLTVQFTIDDPDGELAYHEAIFVDANGSQVECALTIDGSVYTVSADISTLDASGELTLVVYVISNTGWDGTLYSGVLTLPAAPTQVAAEIPYRFNGDSSTLTITYEIYDHGSELSGGYTVRLTDANGNVIESTVDETAGTLTAVIDDTLVDYIFTAYGTTTEGWYGEIYFEEIYIPTAPEITIDIGVESLYEEGVGGEIYIYVSYTSDTSAIYDYEYWLEDMNGQTYSGVWDDTGSYFVVTLAAEDVLEYSADGQLYVVISVSAYGGWQGTAYRELQYI